MLSGKNHKGIVVLLFVVMAAAKAAPTIDNVNRKLTSCTLSPTSNTHNISILEQNRITDFTNPSLSTIAGELLKPPASINSPIRPAQAIFLPAVPGELFLALIGFICVFLVRDRKVWLAAFTALYYLEGIPAKANSVLRKAYSLNAIRNTLHDIRHTNKAPQFAIIGQLFYLSQVANCLVTIAKKFISFSPAFIFESIPRGPP